MSNLQILNNSIRTYENLYSLNDLHVASGGEEKHRPTFFIRLDTTRDLITEIESENSDVQICTSIKSFRTGQNKGTWACEELVLAYATWISPKFHLVVLRAFLAMHKQQCQPKQLALPEPEKKTYTIELAENDITVLLWLWFIAVRVIGTLKLLVKPLQLLQAPIANEIISQTHEYPWTVEHARRILLNISKDLEVNPWRDDNLSRVLPKIRRFDKSDLAHPASRQE